ncbi:ribonuclease 3-like protein 2 isoform X2 [Malus sylvestris]|uniref:ribonuclease 3-like protein 2 isoform X2 n=1 Tax=Malus sylvestris TaxID=3752 RepID=UPI0021ACD261|nr:ribonuclease 3-like protein 2 isoform X2 [Malus sylvestris]
MKLFTTSASLDRELQPSLEMKDSVTAMEKIVGHNFKNKRLLEEALTHSSITYFPSYKRLAVLGDAALGLAMSKHLFRAYPNMDQGKFSELRSANVSKRKFACAAVKHGFYDYLRHNSPALDNEVREFAREVSIWNGKNEATLVYDGAIQPSRVLAEIVESVAAAIYVDLNYDLDKLWMGSRNDTKNLSIACVRVNGYIIASASCKHMEIARLSAARTALSELSNSFGISCKSVKVVNENEAKQNLNVLCDKKRIPKPTYKVKESGPAQAKRFVSSVEIATSELKMMGDERSTKTDAENSAAALMIVGLLQSDAMANTKEAANSRIGYFPSVLYRLWVMIRWLTRLLVFCFKGISLLVIFFTVVKLVIG